MSEEPDARPAARTPRPAARTPSLRAPPPDRRTAAVRTAVLAAEEDDALEVDAGGDAGDE
jgi:hypothetical protein